MARQFNTPFDSIENTQGYLRLLSEELTRVLEELEAEGSHASASASSRYLDALRLACYKVQRLQHHVRASGRILNDLRLIRRLFDTHGDRMRKASESTQPPAAERKPLGLWSS